jgi:hypothetical protein
LLSVVVSSNNEYGAVVNWAPLFALSAWNCTNDTGLSGSVAVAVSVIVPEAVELFAGAVIVTTGGVVSLWTVKPTPLLATPPTAMTTLPVVAPAGTGTTMLAALQLAGVAVTPLNFTVLVPCVAPKFAPLIVTDVPTTPDAGFRFVILGGGPPPVLPGLKAAKTAPQLSGAPRVAPADTVPATVCIRSSAMSLVFGGAGTLASMANPLPAVKVAGFAVKMALSNNSPFHVVAAFALFGDALVPCPAAVISSELAVAIPEYSRIANLSVPRIVSDTVIVFAPPLTFSA